MKCCKEILGVNKKTTNSGVPLELGRIPLELECKKLSIKNWERVKNLQANDLLLNTYRTSMEENLVWTRNIRNVLEGNGMLCFYLNDYSQFSNFIHKKFFQVLVDSFHQDAFSEIKSSGSKLRSYALFKTEKGRERYLTENCRLTDRFIQSKFRLSNHKLMIETGRHKGIEASLRHCPFCPNTVENEIHFLLDCKRLVA